MKKILISFLSLFIFTNHCFAFDAKNKQVSVIIPFAPGGGVDNSFKHLQKYANDRGISLVPVFKSGAEGTIGVKEVSDGQKTGLNVGLTTAGSLALFESKNPEIPKLKYISGLRTTVQVFVTHPNTGLKSLKDLEKAINNGKQINIGIGNPGQRLVWNQYLELSNVKQNPTFVSYRGAGDVLKDIVGGHIEATYLPISVLKGHVDSGQLVALAVTAMPVSEWPNVPTINELYKSWKDLEFGHVFFLPNNSEPEAVKYWTEFLKDYMNDPATKEEFKRTNSVTLPFGEEPAKDAVNNIRPGISKLYSN